MHVNVVSDGHAALRWIWPERRYRTVVVQNDTRPPLSSAGEAMRSPSVGAVVGAIDDARAAVFDVRERVRREGHEARRFR